MKLREIKTDTVHYFRDEQGRKQGVFKLWYNDGQPWEIGHWRDDELHGEGKAWNKAGELVVHDFYINGEEIIDFIENPEQYPSTPEDKTYFALKYANPPFIK